MGKRVLVVDDDLDILALVDTVLSEEGYEVVGAHNGSEAISCLARGLPQLILLDLAMPVMNGWEFVRIVREARLAPATPIVVMTASPQTEDQLRRLAVSGHLTKPFDLDTLVTYAERYAGPPEALVR